MNLKKIFKMKISDIVWSHFRFDKFDKILRKKIRLLIYVTTQKMAASCVTAEQCKSWEKSGKQELYEMFTAFKELKCCLIKFSNYDSVHIPLNVKMLYIFGDVLFIFFTKWKSVGHSPVYDLGTLYRAVLNINSVWVKTYLTLSLNIAVNLITIIVP